jgi:hypothetical protein
MLRHVIYIYNYHCALKGWLCLSFVSVLLLMRWDCGYEWQTDKDLEVLLGIHIERPRNATKDLRTYDNQIEIIGRYIDNTGLECSSFISLLILESRLIYHNKYVLLCDIQLFSNINARISFWHGGHGFIGYMFRLLYQSHHHAKPL